MFEPGDRVEFFHPNQQIWVEGVVFLRAEGLRQDEEWVYGVHYSTCVAPSRKYNETREREGYAMYPSPWYGIYTSKIRAPRV